MENENRSSVEDVLKRYEEAVLGDSDNVLEVVSSLRRHNIKDVLMPEELNEFLQATKRFAEHDHYNITGLFMSQLIQNSYDAGNTEFTLDVKDRPMIHALGQNLRGTPTRPLVLNIDGAAGHLCARDSCYVEINVSGDAESDFGAYVRCSALNVGGEPGPFLGVGARNSTFTVGKYETAAPIVDAINCIYRTSDERALHNLIEAVSKYDDVEFRRPSRYPSGNRVVFVNADGIEEVARDYSRDIR